MEKYLKFTVILGEEGESIAYKRGTPLSKIPKEFHADLGKDHFFTDADLADPDEEDDIEANAHKTLRDMTNAQLDALGMAQVPPIDVSGVRKKDDKIEVLRAGGVGLEDDGLAGDGTGTVG
jgi:hypothetical protein